MEHQMSGNILQKLCVLLAGFLVVSVMPAHAQSNDGGTTIQASEWKFSPINGRPDGRYIKDICLDSEKSKIFTDQDSFLASYFGSYEVRIGTRCGVASLWADIEKHIIFVHSENKDMSDDQAVAAAKKTDVIAILEQSIREEYLDAYKSANNIKDIEDFELKFASSDPDGYIPILQSKKKDLVYKKYKESFENAKSTDDFTSFINVYGSNDPDGLVPLAQSKRDAIKIDIDKAWACKPKYDQYDRRGDMFFSSEECKPPKISSGEVNRLLAAINGEYSKYSGYTEFDNESSRREKIGAQERKQKLISGEIKIQNMDDALLLYSSTETMFWVMESPLLNPDGKVYVGLMNLDAQENSNSLRGQKDMGGLGTYYAFFRTNNKTTFFHKEKLRIGGALKVIGRYIGNKKYQTIGGEEKTAPVLEVLLIEGG
jgi:hypothetical protein